MRYEKKHFKYTQRVRIIKTLKGTNGLEGTITGIASVNWFNTYIVTLDEPLVTNSKEMPEFSSILLSEINLEEI